MDRPDLLEYLDRHGIPYRTWGTGNAKTIDHLVKELAQGESTLFVEKNALWREIRIAALRVYYRHEGRLRYLIEDRQVFADGRVRRRDYLRASVFEKMTLGEQVEAAARRALAEELGIHEPPPLIRLPDSTETQESVSFPGIMSMLLQFNFETHLAPEHFRPEGYIEVQEDKTTYFLWKEI